MREPATGTLTIDGLRTVEGALRPFYVDPRQNDRFMAYQQLDTSGSPRMIVHVVDRATNSERTIEVPLGAYVFQEITAHEFLLLDEHKSVSTVHRIDPPFEDEA